MTHEQPRIIFFNINGSGLGHLSRCLAYARRLQGRADIVFFSLASAVEIIQDMGFAADYFVSEYWSRSQINAWNRELAVRFGLMLEEVRPDAVVFDGTWPFHGFMDACDTHKVSARVWSNRGLHKPGFAPVPVSERAFDLVIQPGEIGTRFTMERESRPGRKLTTPPVTLLRQSELLRRVEAREALGLEREGQYALLSLGPGNLKDIGNIATGLIQELRGRGFDIIWARAPISVRDVSLPDNVVPISAFPLVKYMRAFDIFLGAAGYNTCCEVLLSGVASLLVPNKLVADDQVRRAKILSQIAAVVVSPCETAAERHEAVTRLLQVGNQAPREPAIDIDGAGCAADEILKLIDREGGET